jgi:serine/threonine-protein kinase
MHKAKVERYESLQEIAQGATSTIYKARDRQLGRYVALKVLKEAQSFGRLKREAELMAQLNHPSIVNIFDFGTIGGQPFISMPLIEGIPLSELIAKRSISPREAAQIIEKILWGLQHAHARGVIHRDIKPANIILTQHTPILTDFGLARDIGRHSKTGTGELLGTPLYMSPEHIKGGIGVESDIYSLGAVFYELLTYRPPFQAENFLALSTKILNDDPIPPSKLNPKVHRDLDTICMKALSKSKEQRYNSAAQFANDIRAYLHGEPITARPPGIWELTLRRLRRHKAIAIFASVSLLAVMIGSFVLHAQRRYKIEGLISMAEQSCIEGNFDLALAYLNHALGIDPDNTQVIHSKANLYLKMAQQAIQNREYARAEILLKSAKELMPQLGSKLLEYERIIKGTAKLTIKTEPPGATVHYISKLIKKDLGITPIRPIDIPMGPCSLRLSLPGYKDLSFPLWIQRNEHKDIKIRLVREEEIPEGMVYFPGGEFLLGDQIMGYRRVTLAPFFIDRYEVTCAQYRRFVSATGYRAPFFWSKGRIPKGKANHPVSYISYEDAQAYARWAGKRLPTADEWEAVARGVDKRIFPWGNTPLESNLNIKGSGTEPVGSYSLNISPYGCYDMAGNVWEWTSTSLGQNPQYMVIKGGGWASQLRECATPHYNTLKKTTRMTTLGFRCVKELGR